MLEEGMRDARPNSAQARRPALSMLRTYVGTDGLEYGAGVRGLSQVKSSDSTLFLHVRPQRFACSRREVHLTGSLRAAA